MVEIINQIKKELIILCQMETENPKEQKRIVKKINELNQLLQLIYKN
jgi:hypothetical protein